jgi:hypothetical protein
MFKVDDISFDLCAIFAARQNLCSDITQRCLCPGELEEQASAASPQIEQVCIKYPRVPLAPVKF